MKLIIACALLLFACDPGNLASQPAARLAPVSAPSGQRLFILRARASSFADDGVPKAHTRYHPNYAFDDDPSTAWQATSPNAGEFIEVLLPTTTDVTQLRFLLKNGRQESPALFSQHSRAKTLLIEIPGTKESFTKTLPDLMTTQEIIFPVTVKSLTSIKLTVLDVYEGAAPLCISELQIFASAAPNDVESSAIPDWISAQKALAEENQQLMTRNIPLSFHAEIVSLSAPFSSDDKRYIAAATSLLREQKLVPVALTSTPGASANESYSFGVSCRDAYDLTSVSPEDESYWNPTLLDGDVWELPCLSIGTPTNISGYTLSKTTPSDEVELSLWSTKSSFQDGLEIRAIQLRVPTEEPRRKGSIIGAMSYDKSGHLRAFVSNSEIKIFTWSENGSSDVMLGGIASSGAGAHPVVTKLTPRPTTQPSTQP